MTGSRMVVVLALVACQSQKNYQPESAYAMGGKGDYDDAYGGDYEAAPMVATGSGSGGGGANRRAESRPSAPPPPPPPGQARPMDIPPAEPEAPPPVSAPAAARMVHYDGWAQLRVADPPETLDAVSKLAEAAGGRTEALGFQQVSVRVPVDKFEQVWTDVKALGDLMDQSVRADDVTESFLATDLRARTLRTTRDRLVELLAKAEEEEEKLALLLEITRVTEQLDAIESQLRTLSDLASMSRISVDAVPREAFTGSGDRPELSGFEWIRGLSPFRRSVFSDDHRVSLDVPEGLVGLAPRGPFIAESADGTLIWTLRVPNDPIGDASFWQAALADRISEEFVNPVPRALGAWQCLGVDEPGSDEPYHWEICLRTSGRYLHVAQAYYPGAAQLERYGKPVEAALIGGGS